MSQHRLGGGTIVGSGCRLRRAGRVAASDSLKVKGSVSVAIDTVAALGGEFS